MATSMVLDAIEQAIWTRQQEGVLDLKDVVHHSDRGSQLRFKGSWQHRLFGLRVDDHRGFGGCLPAAGFPGPPVERGGDDVEAPPIDWFNHRRVFEYCGDIPPVDLEAAYYAQHRRPAGG